MNGGGPASRDGPETSGSRPSGGSTVGIGDSSSSGPSHGFE